jgi:ribonuclease HI
LEGNERNEIANGWWFVGDNNTNNEAEYWGLISGLEFLCDEFLKDPKNQNANIVIHGDSKLVIEQSRKKWKCNAPNLKPLLERTHELLKQLDHFSFKQIPRAENKKADFYANKGMDLKDKVINIL